MSLSPSKIAVAAGLPSGSVGAATADSEAAYSAFKSISDHLGKWSDEQAKIEGARQGAVEGQSPDYVSQGATTIRGRARDSAGDATFLAQTQAAFASDAMDALQAHQNDPAGFKAAYDGLAQRYRGRVTEAGPHMVGDFDARATTLGTSLRMKALDGFNAQQQDVARARLYDATNQHLTSVAKLASGDPGLPSVMAQATTQLAALDANMDAMVRDNQLSAEEAAKRKAKARGDTLLTLYAVRADTMSDPAAIATLRGQIGADFRAGKIPMLDGATWENLDTSLGQIARRKQTEVTAAQSTLRSALDDYVSRNSKALTPPAGEWETLQKQAAGIPGGAALLGEARSKLQIEQTMGRMSAVDRKAYLSRLESEAKASPMVGGVRYDGAIDAAAPGKPSPQAMFAYLRQQGASPNEALMLTGAAASESGLNPTATHDGGTGYGLFGHRLDRLANMRKFAGAPSPDWRRQAEFALGELRSRPEAAQVASAKTAQDLAIAQMHFEQPQGYTRANPSGGHNYSGRLATLTRFSNAFGGVGDGEAGVSAPMARVVEYARAADERLARLEKEDPLGAAARSGILPGGQPAPLDLTAPDKFAAGMRTRVAQGEAVGKTLDRAPAYFRPEERTAIAEKLKKGGTAALDLIDGVVVGAGPKALDALAEIGGDAPELAHAAMIGVQSGDDSLKRQVAAALEARRVPNAKPIKPLDATMETALKQEAGDALRGLSLAQRERVKATAALAYEQAAAQRGLDKDAPELAADMVRKALGGAKIGNASYGGVTDYQMGRNWYGTANTVKVQVPPDVRQDRFGEALRAISDKDLQALPDPPVRPDGRLLTAQELLATPPIARAGGYLFGHADATTGEIAAVKAKSGRAFVLNWGALAPEIKKRVPGAFR